MKVSLWSRPQQSYPAHTSSTYDMTCKSDLVERSDSPSTSQPSKTNIAQPLSELDDKITNTLESNYIEEQTPVLNDDVLGSSTLEKDTHHPSSVTWDEKVEVVEPMALNSRVQDVSKLQEPSFEFDKLELVPTVRYSVDDEAAKVNEANFEFDEPDIEPMRLNSWSYDATEVHTADFQLTLVNEPTDQISRSDENLEVYKTSLEHDQQKMVLVIYDKNLPEDIETETDNFVDALSASESESDKDLDCQTRREVESYTHVKDNVESRRIVGNNDDHSLELESPSSLYHDLNQKSLSSLLLSTCEESLQHSPASLDTSGKKVCSHTDDLAPFQTILSSSVQIISCGTELVSHDDNPDKLQQQSDLGVLSSESNETRMIAWIDKETICSPVSEQAPVESCNVNSVALWTNGGLLGLQPSKPPDSPLKQLDCDDKNADSQEPSLEADADDIGFSKCLPQISNSGLDGNLTKPTESNQIYLTPSVTLVEPKDPSAADSMIISNGTVHMNEDGSFLLGFRHGLSINDFGRAKSSEYEESPSQKTHDFKGTNIKEVTSPVNSPPPSPPLEHMKISFQPINNFETFKLKLKYPEGIDHHEENVNVFPSFQLVPEPNHLHHDVVSDSDDDTFCRSNLCMSDDDLSHLSDSVWESGDSSESQEDMPYDGLHRLSYDESISCSGPISDIPILHVMNSFLYQETKISSEQVDLMEAFSMWEPTSDPPPLPPVQWRASNTLSNDIEGSESSPVNHLGLFSLSMNPEPDKLNNTRTRDMNFITRKKAADKSVDDNGDFLQQIRTTSLNLRKTGLLTPTCTSTPYTNVNHTAILQKANTIRQVVASDGEDIDPRSNT